MQGDELIIFHEALQAGVAGIKRVYVEGYCGIGKVREKGTTLMRLFLRRALISKLSF